MAPTTAASPASPCAVDTATHFTLRPIPLPSCRLQHDVDDIPSSLRAQTMPDVSITFTPPVPSSPPTIVAPPKSDTENPKSSDTDALKPSEPEIFKRVDSDTLKHHDSAHPATAAAPAAPQPAPDQSTSAIAPSVVPVIPQSAAIDLPREAMVATANLRPRSKNRPGRPPNINENSLMRRLECIMAVDTGRMTMAAACEHYDISARTFYRWLRSKDRLIELTGFTEEDFKDGAPPPQRTAFPDQIHRMPPVVAPELHSNLPRLSQQPAMAAQSPVNAVQRQVVAFAPPMALKRRMPRIPHYSHSYDDRGLMQSQIYHRNTTKMPAQTAGTADEIPKSGNARAVARKKWGQTLSPGNDIDVRDTNPIYQLQDPDEVAITPNLENSKRRKIARGDSVTLDDNVEDVLDEHPGQSFGGKAVNQGSTNANGSVAHEQSQRQASLEDSQAKAAIYPDTMATVNNGIHDNHSRALDLSPSQNLVQFIECSQKHKIEIVSGQKRVDLAWYHGATSADIKEAIVRRFSLVPGTQWALVDKFSDEIIISDGMPSGRYHLTVLP